MLTCLLALFLLSGCRQAVWSPQGDLSVGPGRLVTMQYLVRLRDDTVVSTSRTGPPFTYVHGGGDLLPALEQALEGLQPGERTTVVIAAPEAYGLYNDAKVESLPRDQFPPDVAVGLEFTDQIGRTLRVVEVRPDAVLVDWNHPLAGQDLIVDVTVVDVRPPPTRPRPQD